MGKVVMEPKESSMPDGNAGVVVRLFKMVKHVVKLSRLLKNEGNAPMPVLLYGVKLYLGGVVVRSWKMASTMSSTLTVVVNINILRPSPLSSITAFTGRARPTYCIPPFHLSAQHRLVNLLGTRYQLQ